MLRGSGIIECWSEALIGINVNLPKKKLKFEQ